jgi:molecular chaperone DnaK
MVIGIDLGTTFSVAAYVDKNGIPQVIPNRDGTNTMPSVVMFDHGEVIVGIQAKNNALTSPHNVAQFAKRHIGTEFAFPIVEDDTGEALYSPEDVSALILSRLKSDCEEFLGQEVTSAVVTVPAYFTDSQKNATIAAGKIANLNVLKIIHEPTAAAMAYGLNNKSEDKRKVLIYDLGGGTFDVTAAEIRGKEITVLASHGIRELGGFDFDNRLIEYAAKTILDETNIDVNEDAEDLQLLRQRCEEAKVALSTRRNYTFAMNVSGKKSKIEISREKFESLIMPILETTGDTIDTVLDEGNINANEIDKVLLVGGSSLIPAVGEYVRKKLGRAPSAEVNPHEAVAIGAAIYADSLDAYGPIESAESPKAADPAQPAPSSSQPKKGGYTIIDTNSHGFGVVVRENGILMNSVVIPRNQPLMKAFVKVYFSSADNQEEISIQVTEGEEDDLRYVNEIGESTINFNPHPKGSPIAVEFKYDENGMITGRIFDLYEVPYETNHDGYLIGGIESLDNPLFIGEVSIKREYALSEDDIEDKKRYLSSLTVQ